MKKIIFLLAILISNIAYSQVCPTQQTRSDSVIACKLKVKNLASGLMKASSIGNVSIATAGTDYTTPTGSEALTNKTYNGITLTGTSTPTLAVTGTTTVSGTNTGDQTTVSGNAGTATALQTARTINGTSFDGTANITVTSAAGTLTGATLASGVTASSLTSFGNSPVLGTPASGVLTNATGYLVQNIATSNISAASWTTSGIKLKLPPIRLTNTTSSGTVAAIYNNLFGGDTMVASSSTTYTNSFGSFFVPAVSSTNVTQTNPYALGLSGNLAFTQATATIANTAFSIQINTGGFRRQIWNANGVQSISQDNISSGTSPFITYAQGAHSGGAQPGILYTAGAHTGVTSGTEISDFNFNLARTITWLTTVPATQRFIRYQAPTMSCASVTNGTTSATVSISGSPAVAGSATVTDKFAFWIESGNTSLNGKVSVGMSTTPTALIHIAAGTGTASTAPLKFITGTLNTVAESGANEYNDSYYQTKNSTLRYGLGGTIFDAFADAGNTTTTETDLHTYTTPTNTLATNGEKVFANYAGTFVSSGTATRQMKVYFGGTAIFDSGTLTISASAAWDVKVTIIRVSSTVVRYTVAMNTQGAALAAYTAVGELTGLTLSNTNIIKITGQAAGVGAATNDIVLKLATGDWKAVAAN